MTATWDMARAYAGDVSNTASRLEYCVADCQATGALKELNRLVGQQATLAAEVVELAADAGMTQKAIAEALGVNPRVLTGLRKATTRGDL